MYNGYDSGNNNLSSFTNYNYNRNVNNNNTNGLTVLFAFVGLIVLVALVFFVPNFLEGNKKYTVTFMDLDGVYLQLNDMKKDSVVTEPDTPTKKGYEFLGWYLDNDLYNFDSPITSDLYLRAKWLNTGTKQIEEVRIPDPTPVPKSNNQNKSNASNNSGGNKSNTNRNSGTSSVQNNTPTPTPTPTPATNSGAETYAVKLNNARFSDGSTNKKFEKGQKVEIYATVPSSYTETNWSGNTSCSSKTDEGNESYKVKHTYTLFWGVGSYNQDTKMISMDGWTAEDGSNHFTYTVDKGGAEITATITEKKEKVDKQVCYVYKSVFHESVCSCPSNFQKKGEDCYKEIEMVFNPELIQCDTNSDCYQAGINNGYCDTTDHFCYVGSYPNNEKALGCMRGEMNSNGKCVEIIGSIMDPICTMDSNSCDNGGTLNYMDNNCYELKKIN